MNYQFLVLGLVLRTLAVKNELQQLTKARSFFRELRAFYLRLSLSLNR